MAFDLSTARPVDEPKSGALTCLPPTRGNPRRRGANRLAGETKAVAGDPANTR